MEQIQPYVLGWLVPTLLSAALGFVAGMLRKAKDDRSEDREMATFTLLTVCRLAIYDDHFSTDEKVDAYRIYKKHGGNHQTKRYMTELLGEDADAYLLTHGRSD